MLFELDRHLDLPLHEQIARRIRELIREGTLPPGHRLPSSRELSQRLGVDRATVAKAFAGLEAAGLVQQARGRRAEVRSAGPMAQPLADAGEALPWLDLRSLSPDAALLPTRLLRQAMAQVLNEHAPATPLDYADPRGDAAYLDMLVRHLRRHAIAAEPASLMATNGAQQAYDLCFRALLRGGDAVVVESPGYCSLLPLLRLHGAQVVGVPMTPEGLDLQALRHAMDGQRIAAVCTTPTFQNPTGVSTSAAHRTELLALCAERGVPLIEDGFVDDLRQIERSVAPIKSWDTGHHVIYIGTFSKLLWPGLRLGWIVAHPRFVASLLQLRRNTELGAATWAQAAMARLAASGALERSIRRVQREYRLRLQCLTQQCLQRLAPLGAHFQAPGGGPALWLDTGLPAAAETELVRQLARESIDVHAGSTSCVSPLAHAHLRLSIARTNPAQIESAIAHLAQTLQQLQGTHR